MHLIRCSCCACGWVSESPLRPEDAEDVTMAVASVGTAVERTLLQRTIPALAGGTSSDFTHVATGAQYPAQPSRGFLPPEVGRPAPCRSHTFVLPCLRIDVLQNLGSASMDVTMPCGCVLNTGVMGRVLCLQSFIITSVERCD
eukprot:142484-Amphidinium_carterae.3